MKPLLIVILLITSFVLVPSHAQNSFILDINGLTEQQKMEAYLAQADRLDAESEILFLVYATQRASEILFFLTERDIIDNDKQEYEARLHYQWARIYQFMQEPQMAMEQLRLGLAKTKQEFLERRIQLLLLTILKNQEEYNQALLLSERLLAQDIRDLQRYNILIQQAQIYRSLSKTTQAANSANAALLLARNELNSAGYEALLELGRIEASSSNFLQAQNFWEQAYDAANRQSNNRMMAQAYYYIAKQHIDQEVWDEGYYFAQRALLLIAGEERGTLFADVQYLLAQYYLHSDNVEQAFISLDLVHQVALRVEHQRSVTTRLALNLSLMRDNNDYALNVFRQKLTLQQRIGYIQIVVIVVLIIAIFVLLRRSWESQAQQRIAELAYKALVRRVNRTSGTLKVQIAKMLGQDYSFGVVVLRLKNWEKISQYPDGNIILELAVDGIKQSLLTQLPALEEAPAMYLHALDHIVFFYFEDNANANFLTNIAKLPQEYAFTWQKKDLILDLQYEHHFHQHDHIVSKEEIFQWLNGLS